MTKIDETRREFLQKLHTHGITSALNAAIEICEDRKAPANARSAASNTLLRAAGFFGPAGEAGLEKPPSEMTAEELAEAIRKSEGRLHKPEPDLFE